MARIEEHMQGGILSLVHEGKCVATAKRGANGAAEAGRPWVLRLHIAACWIDALEREYLDRLHIPRDRNANLKSIPGKRQARKELQKLARQLEQSST